MTGRDTGVLGVAGVAVVGSVAGAAAAVAGCEFRGVGGGVVCVAESVGVCV